MDDLRTPASSVEIARDLAIGIEHLPAVATLDWCDRAAQCVATGLRGTVAAVLIASLSADGVISQVEAVGVGTPEATRGEGEQAAPGVGSVRSELEPLRQLRGASCHWSAWSVRERWGSEWKDAPSAKALRAFDPGDVVVGTCPIPGSAGGRCVIVMMGYGRADSWQEGKQAHEHDVELLRSTTQHLAERAAMAIGVERSTRGRWISERESEVLDQLVLGKSVREIATAVKRSTHTIHDHVKSLHKKLGASSRGELVARALGFVRRRGNDSAVLDTSSVASVARGESAREEPVRGPGLRDSEQARLRATPLPVSGGVG